MICDWRPQTSMSPEVIAIILGSALLGGCRSSTPVTVGSNTGGMTGHEGDGGKDDATIGTETDPQDSTPGEVMPGPDHQLCEMACEILSAIPCSDRTPDCVPFCESQIERDTCAAELRALNACI